MIKNSQNMLKIKMLCGTVPIIVFLLWADVGFSQVSNREKDRRIEQEKIDFLRPSEVAPKETTEIVAASAEAATKTAYFRELIEKKVTFNSDLAKIIVIFMGTEEECLDFDSQAVFLKENGLLPQGMDFKEYTPLEKGLAAYIFCKALGIKGGIMPRILGLSQRYAVKELAYEGIMAYGNIHELVSGKELIIALTQAAKYKLKRRKEKE
jgi:hypothetical protein